MRRLTETHYGIGLILLVCFLSFGLQVPKFGLIWDDYAAVHIYEQYGADELTPWMGGVARPVYGWILTQLWSVIGVQTTPWHLINLGTHILTVLLFWASLRMLFTKNPARNTLIALLFAVYPSYHLRPVMMSNNLSISLALLLLSFWVSLLAARRDNLLLAWLGALLVPAYQLIYDQGLPLEVLRPLAMLWVMGLVWRQKLRRVALMWFPYVVLAGMVFIYRFVLFEPSLTYSDYNEPFNLRSLDGILLSIKRSAAVPVEMLTWDWIYQPWRAFIEAGGDFDLPGLLVTVFLLPCFLYLWRFQRAEVPKTRQVLIVAALSLVVMFALLLPVHLVGRALQPGLNSRWALFPSLLAALVLGLAVPRLVRSAYVGNLALVVFIMLGLATQVAVNQEYIDDWNRRQDIWWQMRWRAPAFEPGTVVAVVVEPDELAFGRLMPDYEMMGQHNLFYRRDDYPAVVAATPELLYHRVAHELPTRGQWSERIIQSWEFDLDEMVVFGYNGGCLATADPTAQTQINAQQGLANLAGMHNPAQITSAALDDLPPSVYEDIPGDEPSRGWCYHYQRVQWAMDAGLPEEAARLANEAITGALVLFATNPAELAPLILALNEVGDYDRARYLVTLVSFSDAHAQAVVCERLQRQSPIAPDEIADQMEMLPGC